MQKMVKKIFITVLFIALVLAGVTACGKSRTSVITNKEKLGSPQNPFIELDYDTNTFKTKYVLKWDRINPAIGYIIDANGVELKTKNNYIDVSDCIKTKSGLNRFTITAEGGKTKENSDESVFEYETEFVSKGLEYAKITDGYSVAKGETDLTKKLVMPDRVNGEAVTKIADDGFTVPDHGSIANSGITAIRFPAYTEIIGNRSFSFADISELNFPKQLKRIGLSAFHCCPNLKELIFPKSIEIIDSGAFYCHDILYSNLEKITFEEDGNLKEIGHDCFTYCKIQEITLPENLEILASENFDGCKYLKEIRVNEKNTHFKAVDGVLYSYDGKTLIKYPPGLEKERFIVPEGVSTIVHEAFTFRMDTVKHIDISSVDYVERHAFSSITAETITLSAKTKTDSFPFGSSHFKTVILPEGTSEIQIYGFNGVYMDYIVIPYSVKTIGRQAFDFFAVLQDRPASEQVHIKYIYYCGNEKDWLKTGYKCNMGEASPTVCFYSENKPTTSGNFWHYDSDGKTPILWAV